MILRNIVKIDDDKCDGCGQCFMPVMKVPCCSGLTQIARQAISKNEIEMSFEDVTIDLQGNVSRTETIESYRLI